MAGPPLREFINTYVRDLTTGETKLVTPGLDGGGADSGAVPAAISADGSIILVKSSARNLTPGETDIQWDVFLVDVASGATTKVSGPPGGGPSTGHVLWADLSGDGKTVVFDNEASLVPGDDDGGARDVFAYDATSGVLTVVSPLPPHGRASHGDMSISQDGHYVAFMSTRSGAYEPGPGRCRHNIVVKDLGTGAATVAARHRSGRCPHAYAWAPSMSDSGFVVFHHDVSFRRADRDGRSPDVYGTQLP